MAEKRTPKRKRGGQPGNSNARKHGMYAAGLAPAQVAAYWKNRGKGADHELAVIYARMEYALRQDPANTRIFREVAKALAKHYIKEYSLDSDSAAAFRKGIRSMVESIRRQRLGGAAITPDVVKELGIFFK